MTPEDDGFREIQLNGKQLVFLFMAATVVSVVIFLTGVLVGRNAAVHAERAEPAQTEAVAEPPTAAAPSSVATPEGSDPRKASPPSPTDDLDVTARQNARQDASDDQPPVAVNRNRPERAPNAPETTAAKSSEKSSDKTGKSAATEKGAVTTAGKTAEMPSARAATPSPRQPSVATSSPVAAAQPAVPPVSAPDAAPDAVKPADTASGGDPASRAGYAVQVAAVNTRGEADAIVKRLSGKAYSAYVEDPKGSVTRYRVRVGTFKTRSEAQRAAERLRKEEKFKPWVTR